MSRKIKFRGLAPLCHGGRRWVPIDDIVSPEEVIPETIGQFTGMRDDHGKAIYEGDIIRYYRGEYLIAIIEYSDTHCGFMYRNEDGSWALMGDTEFGITHAEVEVIGNIYENPELVEDFV